MIKYRFDLPDPVPVQEGDFKPVHCKSGKMAVMVALRGDDFVTGVPEIRWAFLTDDSIEAVRRAKEIYIVAIEVIFTSRNTKDGWKERQVVSAVCTGRTKAGVKKKKAEDIPEEEMTERQKRAAMFTEFLKNMPADGEDDLDGIDGGITDV